MDIVRISDGLGNQMFQYAFARKLSILTGRRVYLDTRFINNEDLLAKGQNTHLKRKIPFRKYGLDHFNIKLSVADDRILFLWKYMQRQNCLQRSIYGLAIQNMWPWQYKKEFLNLERQSARGERNFPTYYQGYFFDLEYYDDIRKILQYEFSLTDKIKLPHDVSKILCNENTVSVHVRRGDFLKLDRDMSNSGYYQKALQVIESKVKSPEYLIFSDDIDWVKNNIEIPGRKLYVSEMGFKDYEELTIMKHCRHNIIANSTFSYWAAYLNSNESKIVICPKGWRKNIIPENWIES